jgi:hypothetical protein
MANPSNKSEPMTEWLERLYGRTTAIQDNRCASEPFGCGGPVSMEDFEDEKSRKEYTISGLCMKCQKEIFGDGDDG